MMKRTRQELTDMDVDEFREGLARLETSQSGFGRLLGVNSRTAERWAVEGPTPPAAFAMRLLLALKLTAADAQEILKGKLTLRRSPARSRDQGDP
jgi:DNA-binding transcriptional regulator YiaG